LAQSMRTAYSKYSSISRHQPSAPKRNPRQLKARRAAGPDACFQLHLLSFKDRPPRSWGSSAVSGLRSRPWMSVLSRSATDRRNVQVPPQASDGVVQVASGSPRSRSGVRRGCVSRSGRGGVP
jgi:hypothetical protein